MFTSNISLVTLVRGVGGKLSRLVYLAPRLGLNQTMSSVNSYCIIILEYLVVRDVNIISANLRCLHPTSVWLPLSEGWGASCPGWFILPPRLGFVSGSVISQFLLHHNLGIFSCKRYKHYFRQTEMFTSNVQFGYPCLRGGGQAVQAGLSCPPPRIWVEQCHQFILIAP